MKSTSKLAEQLQQAQCKAGMAMLYDGTSLAAAPSQVDATSPWANVSPDGPKLRPEEVCKLTGLSRSKIYALIHQGKFPPFLKPSARVALMPEARVNAYFRSLADDAVEQQSSR